MCSELQITKYLLRQELVERMIKLIDSGIAPRGIIVIGLVPMGIVTFGVVDMGLINACVVGCGLIVYGIKEIELIKKTLSR